jgi:hypothetical protein
MAGVSNPFPLKTHQTPLDCRWSRNMRDCGAPEISGPEI